MKKRVLALIIAVFTVLSSFAVFGVVTGASSPAPELNLAYANLSFRDSVCMKFALAANVDNVKLLVWTSPETEYVKGTEDGEISNHYNGTISGVSYKMFDYPIMAKQMADVIYVRAYVRSDNTDYYSNVVKYSVLQYAYNKLGKTATASKDTELKALLTAMLEYGAAAQLYLDDYKADRLANANWYQVKLTAGLLGDGFNNGLYLPGDKVTLTAPETDANGVAFSYWADSNGASVATTANFILTVANKNEVYTPIYGEAAEEYSEGLEFESNGDGTCILLGMGDFSGTELVIPPEFDGDSVTEIDSRAFQNEAITLVKIPATVTDIGSRAFNGCTVLTDVYYDGTEEEWNNNVSIGSNNAPLENATMHFNTPAQPDVPENNYTEPTIAVSNVTASAGESVEVTVSIYNNPGIIGMTLALNYDESALTLTKVTRGAALKEMSSFAAPKELGNGCKFPWATETVAPDDVTNGVILTLSFTVNDSANAGNYDVAFTYNNGAIIDNDLNAVDMDIVKGSITVK